MLCTREYEPCVFGRMNSLECSTHLMNLYAIEGNHDSDAITFPTKPATSRIRCMIPYSRTAIAHTVAASVLYLLAAQGIFALVVSQFQTEECCCAVSEIDFPSTRPRPGGTRRVFSRGRRA